MATREQREMLAKAESGVLLYNFPLPYEVSNRVAFQMLEYKRDYVILQSCVDDGLLEPAGEDEWIDPVNRRRTMQFRFRVTANGNLEGQASDMKVKIEFDTDSREGKVTFGGTTYFAYIDDCALRSESPFMSAMTSFESGREAQMVMASSNPAIGMDLKMICTERPQVRVTKTEPLNFSDFDRKLDVDW